MFVFPNVPSERVKVVRRPRRSLHEETGEAQWVPFVSSQHDLSLPDFRAARKQVDADDSLIITGDKEDKWKGSNREGRRIDSQENDVWDGLLKVDRQYIENNL